MKLNEGLRANDLKGMLLNIVSVDEYESKIDESAIVITFYLTDRHAAQDAVKFIQKSYVEVLDAEVSPAPDQNGDYLVFIELPLNSKLNRAIVDLCRDLSALGDIKAWKVRVLGRDITQALPFDAIEQAVRDGMSNNLEEFFSSSDSFQDVIVENTCKLVTETKDVQFNVTDFGDFDSVATRNNIAERPVSISLEAQRTSTMFKKMLGESWSVEQLEKDIALYNNQSNKLLLLTLIN